MQRQRRKDGKQKVEESGGAAAAEAARKEEEAAGAYAALAEAAVQEALPQCRGLLQQGQQWAKRLRRLHKPVQASAGSGGGGGASSSALVEALESSYGERNGRGARARKGDAGDRSCGPADLQQTQEFLQWLQPGAVFLAAVRCKGAGKSSRAAILSWEDSLLASMARLRKEGPGHPGALRAREKGWDAGAESGVEMKELPPAAASADFEQMLFDTAAAAAANWLSSLLYGSSVSDEATSDAEGDSADDDGRASAAEEDGSLAATGKRSLARLQPAWAESTDVLLPLLEMAEKGPLLRSC